MPSLADTPPLVHFTLGQHELEVRAEPDGGLSLWLDGCLRKRRGSSGSAAYLWTNVELPFEDHHLVEVRRTAGTGDIAVSENGRRVATVTAS